MKLWNFNLILFLFHNILLQKDQILNSNVHLKIEQEKIHTFYILNFVKLNNDKNFT